MKYPKIDTVWKRDVDNKNRIIEGDFTRPEFDNVKKWRITEKIDGTNIRITFGRDMEDTPYLKFDGKTDDAQISAHLFKALQETFTIEKLSSVFGATPEKPAPNTVVLFGEGYGTKINGDKFYRDGAGFILFDVNIDGWWLEHENVMDIAQKLNIPVVPVLGIMDLNEAVSLVKTKTKLSEIAMKPRVAEGIVARSYPIMLFRDGLPIMWKLKVKDYK
jgi:ATP-dependent RNA circularization protein (DNA/RNA ligase family)